jgi:phosphatidylglycerol:prolipoprotein diacylglycerol transferase
MYQEIFRIPFLDRPVYGYGLMLVIGFLAGAQLARWLANRWRLDGETFVNASLLALISGVIGARLSHVLESLSDPASTEFARNGRPFGENLWAMLNMSSGGLTFYGGFLLATPVLILYAIWKKVPLLRGMDIVAPALMVGLAFGRVGCFMNGCCYGAECSLPWGASFPYGSNAFVEQFEKGEIDVPRELTATTPKGHVRLLSKDELRKAGLEKRAEAVRAKPVQPTQLYSAFNAFLIAAACVAYLSTIPVAGRVFALMLMLKGVSRFTLEMLRVEPPFWFPETLGWSFSMGISVMLVIAGVLMWWGCGRLARREGGDGHGRFPVVAPA